MNEQEKREYQEAWNKITEYMNNLESLSFHINCWDPDDNSKYTLATIDKDKDGTFKGYRYHFVADSEWDK